MMPVTQEEYAACGVINDNSEVIENVASQNGNVKDLRLSATCK